MVDDYIVDESVVGGIVVPQISSVTIQDSDPYLRENPDDTDWVMDLGNLMSFSDHVIGIENDFVKDDSSDMPAGVGECYSLPTEYVKICLEGLNVADDEYMELVQEYTNAVDFTKAGFPTLTSEPALYIHTNSQEGLVLHQSLLVWSNGTALDRYTNKIWIYAPGINAEYRIFYEDAHGDIQYAGN